MSFAPLRWGIASAGKICYDFCIAISTLPSTEHRVVAVAARDITRANEFAKAHEITQAHGSYEELMKNPEVDIVYVGALNPQHFEIVKLALTHKKHVLCEKPLCMNHKQAQQLIELAKSQKLFLMEAIWSRFFPAFQYLRQQIDAGALGNVQEVEASFGFPHVDVDRLQKKSFGGGTVLDLGVYTIQASQWVFREAPQKIEATGELNADGVDIEVKAKLNYNNGRVARIHMFSKGELHNKFIIKGDKGQITIPQFWCPTKIIDVDGATKEWSLPVARYQTNYPNSVGLCYEAEAVRQTILAGKLENENVSHNESLIIAQIEDEIRKQVGVVYDVD